MKIEIDTELKTITLTGKGDASEFKDILLKYADYSLVINPVYLPVQGRNPVFWPGNWNQPLNDFFRITCDSTVKNIFVPTTTTNIQK